MHKFCDRCKKIIPAARLEVLPDTTTCVKCSTEEKVQGVMIFDHKTAPVLSFLPKDPEQRRQAINAHKRKMK